MENENTQQEVKPRKRRKSRFFVQQIINTNPTTIPEHLISKIPKAKKPYIFYIHPEDK